MPKLPQSLRIVLISDTHECHRSIDLMPEGDVLLCVGDWTMMSRSMRAVADFNAWLGELPHRHRILVPGNHETYLDADPSLRSLTSNATMLIDEGIEIAGGLLIWGTPITPYSHGAFWVPDAAERRRIYGLIPDNIDILISHGPAYGVLDCEPGATYHGGDPELLEAVRRIKPRLHVFGHVHAGHGKLEVGETLHVNAAMLDDGGIERLPIVVRMTANSTSYR